MVESINSQQSNTQAAIAAQAKQILSESDTQASSSKKSTALSKQQLQQYLTKLQSEGEGSSKIAQQIQSAISGNTSGGNPLTAVSIQSAMQSLQEASKAPQDPETVTKEQVQSPVDVRL